MTGMTRGPEGINSHVPVESTADAWQESKLLGCVVSWIRLPIEAIKTVAGILYSVVDKGELASRSLKNLGISLIGSCPVLGAIEVTKLHQGTVTMYNHDLLNYLDIGRKTKYLTWFFEESNPKEITFEDRILAHRILQNMPVDNLTNIYYKLNIANNPVAVKITAFLFDRFNRDPDNISYNDLRSLQNFAIKIDWDEINKLNLIVEERGAAVLLQNTDGTDWDDKTVTLKHNEVLAQKASIWRNELLAAITQKLST